MKRVELTAIVKRALVHSVTDIGQLTPEEKRELTNAVKRGWLSKGKGGAYPIAKTVYGCPGFDFAAQRRRALAYMAYLHNVDTLNRMAQTS